MIGYVCIAIAIGIATVILLYQAYGFGLNKKGQVVQDGLLFVSSTPGGAEIYLNGTDQQKTTNTRLSLVSGQYNMKLTRNGYRDWERKVNILGGFVDRFDYPFLIPKDLTTANITPYDTLPASASQSPDHRWVLVQHAGTDSFDLYDLKNPKNPAAALQVPANVITTGANQTYEMLEWANDNQHVLIKHTYDSGKYEFIMLDVKNPDQSVNLSTALGATPTTMTLINKKYDQYYLYDSAAQTLSSASLGTPTPKLVLDHVLAYKSYSDNMILYASSQTADGTVAVKLLDGSKTYTLRTLAAGTTYLLDLTQYSGSWYVVVGAGSEDKVYIYKNPMSQLDSGKSVLVPVYILRVPAASYVSFSPNARFIVAENGTQFGVYDAEYPGGYVYDTKLPVDAPQPHANWMDGNHLDYVSGGKLVMFDFDEGNLQTLMPAAPNYVPFFSPDYKFVDVIAAPTAQDVKAELTSTSLRTPADQ